jgi:hypothetical protein
MDFPLVPYLIPYISSPPLLSVAPLTFVPLLLFLLLLILSCLWWLCFPRFVSLFVFPFVFVSMSCPARERRIAILGYVAVGKSSLAIQFVKGQFGEQYEPTIENSEFLVSIQLSVAKENKTEMA